MRKITILLLSICISFCILSKDIYALTRGGGMGWGYGENDIFVSISQVGSELRFECDNDTFLSKMCEKSTINFNIYLEDDLGEQLHLKTETLYSLNNEMPNNTILSKESDYAVMHNIDTILHNGYYQIEIEDVIGFDGIGHGNVTISNCIEPTNQDNVTFSENDDGTLKISCDNTDYISNIYDVIITPTIGRSVDGTTDSFIVAPDNKSLSFSFGTDSAIGNETIEYSVKSKGYQTIHSSIILEHQPLLPCPEFNTSLNEQGDLIITSNDENWINALCENRTINETITGKYTSGTYNTPEYRNYSFSDSNVARAGSSQYITKLDNNTACYSSLSQRTNGSCVNGITYSTYLQAKGYEKSNSFDLTFTKASKLYPSDTTFKLIGNLAVIHSSDTSFIDYCNSSKYRISLGSTNGHKTIGFEFADSSQGNTPELIDSNTICFDLS